MSKPAHVRCDSALDWVYQSTERGTYWWACRLCGGYGWEKSDRIRVEGLLARHLRERHGCPVLVAARAVSLGIEAK